MSVVDRRLAAALLDRAGRGAALLHAHAQPWATATFEGQRHVLEVALPTAAAAAFTTGLEEVVLPLPRHFLADLAVEDRHDDGTGTTRLRIGALVLADG